MIKFYWNKSELQAVHFQIAFLFPKESSLYETIRGRSHRKEGGKKREGEKRAKNKEPSIKKKKKEGAFKRKKKEGERGREQKHAKNS